MSCFCAYLASVTILDFFAAFEKYNRVMHVYIFCYGAVSLHAARIALIAAHVA